MTSQLYDVTLPKVIHWRIPTSYTRIKHLGGGGFGVVAEAEETTTGQKVRWDCVRISLYVCMCV